MIRFILRLVLALVAERLCQRIAPSPPEPPETMWLLPSRYWGSAWAPPGSPFPGPRYNEWPSEWKPEWKWEPFVWGESRDERP